MIKLNLNKKKLIKTVICISIGTYLLKNQNIYINIITYISLFILSYLYSVIKIIIKDLIRKIQLIIMLNKYIRTYTYFDFILSVIRSSTLIISIFKLYKNELHDTIIELFKNKIYNFIIEVYNKYYNTNKYVDNSEPIIYIIYCNIKKYIL